MSEAELKRALRERPVPGEAEARERTLRVLRAAHAAGARSPAGRRRSLRPAIALVVAALALGTGLSPAGADVRDWIGDRLDPEPTLSSLPSAGRLLVSSPQGSWVVNEDGLLRRLGDYSSAGWSPRGLFAVAASGRRLYAVEPDGTVRWSIARPGRVGHPAWSPGDGFRVAYLEGATLRVVAGDGSGDRLVDRGVAAVTPAWRPGPGYVLSYATADGRIVTRDVLGGRVLWSARVGERPARLEWTARGDRLVALAGGAVLSYAREGAPGPRRELPAGVRARVMAVHPSGRSVAVAGTAGGVVGISLSAPARRTRKLFDGDGRFTGLAWSPDGRWLAAGWHDADQWVFVRSPGARRGAAGARRVVTFSRIAEQLDPGGNAGFPRLDGWCCG
jgi:WD40 repeat protein